MRRSVAWAVFAAAVACVVLSLILPWAYYGTIAFSVRSFPGWPGYVVAQCVALGCAVLPLSGRVRAVRPALLTVVFSVVAACVTVLLAVRYGDSSAFFDTVVPMVRPHPGAGGAVGLLGAFASGAVAGFSKWHEPVPPRTNVK